MLAFYIVFGFQNLPIKCVSNVILTLPLQFTDPTNFQNKLKKKKEVSPSRIFLQSRLSKENRVCI